MNAHAATSFDGIAAVMIDLDGTLVDTLGDFHAALNAMLAELGLSAVDLATVARCIGKGSEHLVMQTLREVGGDASSYDLAYATYQRCYADVNHRYSAVYPGVVEGLDMLAGIGLPLVCLTNKPTVFAESLLAAKGLQRYFAFTFGGDAFARKKPDPMPLIEACRALGCAPSQTLMVGDSSNDVAAARAAGCPVALVSYGYNHGEPASGVDADALVDRLDSLRISIASRPI